MEFNSATAKAFVDAIDLSNTRRFVVHQDANADAVAVFDKAKAQAQVVGSGLFSFQQGVDAPTREFIADSALLAQLHANKQISFDTDPKKWFGLYTQVLQNVGWNMQDLGFNNYTGDGTQLEVNEKIINLLTSALGPAAGAATIVIAAINALKDMDPRSSWITIWSREVLKAKMARFQVGLVNSDGDGKNARVDLVACILSGQTALTQVLFFKWKEAHASLQAATCSASINAASMAAIAPTVRAKIIAYQTDYLSTITDV